MSLTKKIRLATALPPSTSQPLLTQKQRLRHIYALGKTRSGKSTFLLNLLKNDLDHAIVVIDPVGSFALDVAGLVDKDRLIYVDKDNPICFNPLVRYKWDRAATEFAAVMNECVTLTTSTGDSSILMNGLMLGALEVFKDEHKNIKYLADFFDSQKVRKKHFDSGIQRTDFWTNFEERIGNFWVQRERRESATRVSIRLLKFYKDTVLSPFTMGDDEFDVVDIVANKKIVVFNLRGIDDEGQLYIGNLISHAIKSYIQYDAKESSPQLHFYIDEFHRFINVFMADMLSQSSKFNVSYNLAHQNHQQISEKVLGAILGNVETFATFSCGYDEAFKMSKVYQLKPFDFQNLGSYKMWIKISRENFYCKGFPPPNITSYIPPTAEPKDADPLKKFNFLKDAWINT